MRLPSGSRRVNIDIVQGRRMGIRILGNGHRVRMSSRTGPRKLVLDRFEGN